MDAGRLIETIIKAGMLAKRAYEAARAGNGDLDWPVFIDSDEFATVQHLVAAQLDDMTVNDVTRAVDRIRAKQVAFLHGREISQLSIEELLQFGDLADAEGILVRKQMKQLGSSPEFIGWLVHDALPVLAKVAKVVLPLVL